MTLFLEYPRSLLAIIILLKRYMYTCTLFCNGREAQSGGQHRSQDDQDDLVRHASGLLRRVALQARGVPSRSESEVTMRKSGGRSLYSNRERSERPGIPRRIYVGTKQVLLARNRRISLARTSLRFVEVMDAVRHAAPTALAAT